MYAEVDVIGGRYRGVALACFIEGGGAGPKELARLVLELNGTVIVSVGSAAVGQGLETVMAHDCRRLALADARQGASPARLDDSAGRRLWCVPFALDRARRLGGARGGSDLARKIRAAAAARLDCTLAESELIDGKAVAKSGRSVEFAELGEDGLSADYAFANDHRHTSAYGTAAAHVRVDPGIGRVDFLDDLVVEDVGRIVNPHPTRAGHRRHGAGARRHFADDCGRVMVPLGQSRDHELPTFGPATSGADL